MDPEFLRKSLAVIVAEVAEQLGVEPSWLKPEKAVRLRRVLCVRVVA